MTNEEHDIEAIHELAKRVSFEEVAEDTAVLASIRIGLRDLDVGRIVLHDDIKKRLNSWISRPAG